MGAGSGLPSLYIILCWIKTTLIYLILNRSCKNGNLYSNSILENKDGRDLKKSFSPHAPSKHQPCFSTLFHWPSQVKEQGKKVGHSSLILQEWVDKAHCWVCLQCCQPAVLNSCPAQRFKTSFRQNFHKYLWTWANFKKKVGFRYWAFPFFSHPTSHYFLIEKVFEELNGLQKEILTFSCAETPVQTDHGIDIVVSLKSNGKINAYID